MSIDDRGRAAGQRTVVTFEASTNVAQAYDRLADVRRSQRRNRTVALAAALVVAVFAIFVVQSNPPADSTPQPMEPVPGIDLPGVPVWYDAQGLHHGAVVEQTPAKDMGALALVRTGALYQDAATRDLWFHPWGGDPRIVGRNVIAGPGGDPDGHTAAWFERTELVVYDTATGQEISRSLPTNTMHANCLEMCAEHYPAGSQFLQVSAERVVWSAGPGEKAYTYDVSTQETTELETPVIDVHDDVLVTGDNSRNWAMVLHAPGGGEERYPDMEPRARLSPGGNYVLAVEERNHDAAIVDTMTGDVWYVQKIEYPWIAWSYGDIALIDTEDDLLACDAFRRTCEKLPARRPFLMPTT